MSNHQEFFVPNEFSVSATGDHTNSHDFKYLVCTLGKYQIKVKVTVDNKFLSVEEIKVDKDFLTQKQRSLVIGHHNVDDIYQE